MTRDHRKTVSIVGAGSAGAATALSLAQAAGPDINIQLFDARPASEVSAKIGESIPPAATPILQRLGVASILGDPSHLVCPGNRSLWDGDVPGHNDFWIDPVGRGYHLDRALFDRQLLEAANEYGAQCYTGWRLKQARRAVPGFELVFHDCHGTPRGVRSDFVVDASGCSAVCARRLGVARNLLDTIISLSIAIGVHSDTSGAFSHTLLEAVHNGWWYAAPLPGNRLIVSFSTDLHEIRNDKLRDPVQWVRALLATRWLRDQLPDRVFSALQLRLQTHVAPTALLSAVSGGSWIAVGDAAFSVDPLTSAGITKALGQGELAGEAMSLSMLHGQSAALDAYQDSIFAQFRDFLGIRRYLYQSATRYSADGFWRRRLGLERQRRSA